MNIAQSSEEQTLWQKRLAAQANNRAWTLAESLNRKAEEDDEMLNAAHTAMYFWSMVGNESNRAHAAQLLAHVYALLKFPELATRYLRQSRSFFLDKECAAWEKAFAHLIAANVASAASNAELHFLHYQQAQQLIAGLDDEEDRKVLLASLRVIPVPEVGNPA